MIDRYMSEEVATAKQHLALLSDEADVLRVEVARLRAVQKGLSGPGGERIAHVNEQLVLAALHADAIAEQAVKDLHALALSGQHDALTGTPNRTLLVDRLETAIAMARRDGSHIAVLFIDIDRFKSINDTMGHAAGDKVLQRVARQLTSAVRDADTVSRYGGDEFVVLLSDVAQASDAALIAAKLLSTLAMPSLVGGDLHFLSASIGIAMYPEDGEDALTLIGRADAAMYRSKRRFPGCVGFYQDDGSQDVAADAPMTRAAAELARELHAQNLCDANERLVIAAMAARETKAQIDATHRRQIAFLATVVHELRNVVTPIFQAAELMYRPSTQDPRLARLQAIIKRQVEQLTRLIDDLLDGSRISTGKFRVERRTVDLASIIELAIATGRPTMERMHQKFTTRWQAETVMVHADVLRLTQVFSNLLDNASKYTPEGGNISLAVEIRDQAVAVTIADDGIGIAGETLPKIFELFVQDEHAMARDGRGLGIGLAVVRELVEAHRGTVIGTSAGMHLGSSFTVTLPMLG